MNEVTQPINRSRRLARGALAVLVGTALWFHQPLLAWFSGRPLSIARHDAPVDRSRSKAIDHYTCSMHPSVHQSAPGTCPICGMNLVPVTEEQQREGIVTIEPARQQLIGVRTAEVIEAPMVRSIRAIGRVEYDESKLTEISSRVHGWIERLLVNQTGEPVQKGQTLFTLYSPELYSAQQDLLLATRASSMSEASAPHHGRDLASAARQRLHLLDLADDQIEAVIQRGEPLASVAIASRATGFVIEKNVVEGGSIEPGMRLYRIAPLDPIWIAVDVYAADMAEVRAGQRATVTLDALPGRNYEARVAYVYPAVESATRTGQVRLELANRSMELRPGMYASVELRSEVASKIQVPVSAVVYTGRRRLVFVDLGGGHFRAREIELGFESDGMYEVRAGLERGERVAASGVFLIAAEARISSATNDWDSAERGTIGSGAAPLPPTKPVAPPPRHPIEKKRIDAPSGAEPPPSAAGSHATYSCPMHPEVRSESPGTCPKCGMSLVPVNLDSAP